jgi:hypothetical protein
MSRTKSFCGLVFKGIQLLRALLNEEYLLGVAAQLIGFPDTQAMSVTAATMSQGPGADLPTVPGLQYRLNRDA